MGHRERLFEHDVATLGVNEPLEHVLAPMEAPFQGGRLLHVALLVKRRDPLEAVSRLTSWFPSLTSLAAEAGSGLFFAKETSTDSRVVFRVTSLSENLAVLVTFSTTRTWRLLLHRLIERLHPWLYRPFLRQPDLHLTFDSIQNALNECYRVRLKKVTTLKRLVNQTTRRRFESGIRWTDIDYKDAFEQAAESFEHFNRASFEVWDESGDRPRFSEISGFASRGGHFAINCRAGWFYRVAVLPAAVNIEKDLALYRNRARELVSQPRPIQATFQNLDLTRSDLPKIAAEFQRFPHSSVSVLHGNPYFRASIVDMLDGSSFDLVLGSERRLLILPQLRATESAVTRLCRFVYDRIGEATFSNAENAP